MSRFGSEGGAGRRRLAIVAVLGIVGAVALVLASGVSAKRQATPIKAAWIYVGPHNDAGSSQAHDMGRLYVQKKLGANVKTTYKENIANGPQLEQTVASLVRDGNKIIFGTSFGFFSKKLAAKYPNVLFEQATGTDLTKNMAEYFGAGEDSIYLPAWPPARPRRTARSGTSCRSPSPR